MADISTREKWEREFDSLDADGFISGLSGSKKPNNAPPHNSDTHLKRARRMVSSVVDSLLRATVRLASPEK